MADVIMPKMGDAMTEGKVLTWRKRPGDTVAKGEPIAEIETDKVNVDIEAEEAGTLVEILVGEGQTAAVGAKIAAIGAPGQAPSETFPGDRLVKAGRAETAQMAAVAPAGPAPTDARMPRPTAPVKIPAAQVQRLKVSPLARRLADERGIDLTLVRGTGPEGRITKEDVEAYLTSAPARPSRPAAEEAYEDLPVSRMRQTISRRMVESKQQAPHFYITVEVAMDEALRAREQLNAAVGEDRKTSINDLVIRAAAMALRQFPNLNSASIDGTIRRYRRVNIAIGVALPEGLVAPVIPDCDRLSVVEIASRANALAERARSGHLRPADYEGGTFTISSLGMFDVESFMAIINPPHAAILAVGSAQPRPVVRHGQITVASTMKLTISADHRVTDGAEVARFLGEVKRLLENPLLLFLDSERTG